MERIEGYAEAWLAGEVCLHPTDTLPGLSYNPRLPAAEALFRALKGRAPDKTPISLVGDWSVAARMWEPLPTVWGDLLQELWPSPLSVVWKASALCPASLKAQDGSCGLRMPRWTRGQAWMRDLLLRLDSVFPSSSVNESGRPSARDWAEALAFASGKAIYVPTALNDEAASGSAPSTLIRLHGDGTWDILREGRVSPDVIQEKWEEQHAKRP